MNDRHETLMTSTETDSALSYAAEHNATEVNDQTQQAQPSILELNSMLLVVMSGLAALFTAAAFLLSHA